ncbi:unnamed protein product [Brassica oleracea var. botrytis]
MDAEGNNEVLCISDSVNPSGIGLNVQCVSLFLGCTNLKSF